MLPVAVAGCTSSCPDDGRPTPDRVIRPEDSSGAIPDPTSDWPTFRGTARNTGFREGARPPATPATAWATELPGSASASAPVLADGTVYVVDGDGTLRALDARNGSERWAADAGTGPIREAPTVTDDGVLVAGESGTALYAEADVRWTTDHAAVASAVVGEHAYVPTEAELLALDPADGSVNWRAPFDGPVSRPALGRDGVYVAAPRLVALSPTGERRWGGGPERLLSFPVVADAVYAGNDDHLRAFDPTGGERWQFDRGDGRGFDAPVVTPGSLYTVERVGEGPDALYALDPGDDGPAPRWCAHLGEGSIDAAAPMTAMLAAPANEGPQADFALQSLSSERGESGWALQTRSRVSAPALTDGGMFLTAGRTVIALGDGGETA